ncbi:MAG: radical SAM protein [Desulfobacteraceae bacterium]
MRVMIISANTEVINMPTPAAGAANIAASAKNAGHEVLFSDLMGESDIENKIKTSVENFNPELIGVSIRNIDDQSRKNTVFLLDKALPVIKACKRSSKAPLVLGGAGYSIFPSAVLDYLDADFGIQGEGETAFPALIESIKKGNSGLNNISGLYQKGKKKSSKRFYEKNLDNFCFAGPEYFDSFPAGNPDIYIPFQTRRGCPLGCSYCSTSVIEGRSIRYRSVSSAVSSLKEWIDSGFKHFFFVDNTFNLPLSYAKNLCRNFINEKLDFTWRAIVYPGKVDSELAELMAKSGCTDVSLGFESGCRKTLQAYNKHFSPGDILKSVNIFKKTGIKTMGFLMLGGPGETENTVMESLEFADSLSIDSMQITSGVRIYPYTELARTALKEGLISPDDNLLYPKFYMVKELENLLDEILPRWCRSRSNWDM